MPKNRKALLLKRVFRGNFSPKILWLEAFALWSFKLCIFSYKKRIRDSKKIGCDTVVKHAKTDWNLNKIKLFKSDTKKYRYYNGWNVRFCLLLDFSRKKCILRVVINLEIFCTFLPITIVKSKCKQCGFDFLSFILVIIRIKLKYSR